MSDIIKKVLPNLTTVHIDSPRGEFTGEHYYNIISDKLKDLGYEPTRTMEDEVRYIMDTIKLNVKLVGELQKVVKPRTIF